MDSKRLHKKPQSRLEVRHIFFYPDYNRRLWNHTRSADPARCRRSRAFTAGGESHPALKTHVLFIFIIRRILGSRSLLSRSGVPYTDLCCMVFKKCIIPSGSGD
jgi:hypothetical protein